MDALIEKYKLFWQYPVITEKEFHKQNLNHPQYLGFPWATVIDKAYNLNVIYKILISELGEDTSGRYTCCQHIHFRKLISLFKALNIKTLYTPHKVKREDYIEGIRLYPCPLYAVNVEDPSRNMNISTPNSDRNVLYSFMGGYQPANYLTTIRQNIFDMEKHDSAIIVNTGQWHFNNAVYSEMQNNKLQVKETDAQKANTIVYNKLLSKSRFSLCPSGSGPNSIRFWESLAVGAIPVLLADTLELPELPEHMGWNKSIIILKESKLHTLHDVLSKISTEQEREMRQNCLSIYSFFKNKYVGIHAIKLKREGP